MVGLSTLGIVAAAGRGRGLDRRVLPAAAARATWWRTVVAPLIGAVGLLVAGGAADGQLPDADRHRLGVGQRPAGAARRGRGRRPRAARCGCAGNRPAIYRRPGRVRPAARPVGAHGQRRRRTATTTATASSAAARPGWSWRARSTREGIPFDLVRAAHARSAASGTSTTRAPRCTTPRTSSPRSTPRSFFGYPMPADYPDYPTPAQILSYVADFAARLRPRPHGDASASAVVSRRRPVGGRLGGRAVDGRAPSLRAASSARTA